MFLAGRREPPSGEAVHPLPVENGVECGSTIDFSCIFQPIQCGDCSGGKLCDFGGKCVPRPVNSCDPEACASKKCGYVPANNSYECIAWISQGNAKNMECDPGYRCVPSKYDNNYYCQQYCVTQADCTNGKKCTPLDGPTSYGSCQ